jgi:hypothetical protein
VQLNPFSKSSLAKATLHPEELSYPESLVLPDLLDKLLLSLSPTYPQGQLCFASSSKERASFNNYRIHSPHCPINKATTGCLAQHWISHVFSLVAVGEEGPPQPEAVFPSSYLLGLLRAGLGTPLSQDTQSSWILIILYYVLVTGGIAADKREQTFKWSYKINPVVLLPDLAVRDNSIRNLQSHRGLKLEGSEKKQPCCAS